MKSLLAAGATVFLLILLAGWAGGRPEAGASCADGALGEFVRQQEMVEWDVFCPSELPARFRLATADDAPGTGLGIGAAPTIDQLYAPDPPSASTFITRFVDGSGGELVLVQGAGANIYYRRDEGRCIGCSEVPRRGAMFGDLSGTLYSLDPAAVTAFDDDMGHMLVGYGMAIESVIGVAESMLRVRPRPETLTDGLLRVIDLSPGEWLPFDGDPFEGDAEAERPVVCEDEVIETDAPRALVLFSGTTWPYEDGHPPSLQQALFEFEDEAGARDYVEGLDAAIGRCVGQQFVERLDYIPIADGSIAYRGKTRSDVQGADIDVVAVRAGDRVSVLWYFELVPPDGSTRPLKTVPIAEAAARRMTGELE